MAACGILRALKAANAWMTYAEIVDALIVAHGLVLPPDGRRHFQQKIREVFHPEPYDSGQLLGFPSGGRA